MKSSGYLLVTAVTALLLIRVTESGTQVFRNRRSIRVCTPRDVARIGHFLCKRSISSLDANKRGPDESDTEAFEAADRNESRQDMLPEMFMRLSEAEGRGSPASDGDLENRMLQKRSSSWPRRRFETIGDIRRYCCHHDCPIELFIAECA
ncbi:uncharacterized protein [Palaemon carinicauda]|uniref:uncharacterized protein n=1 Tax=Palaemon carinicauda TaxID=392227 RepID=UPI0035B59DD9